MTRENAAALLTSPAPLRLVRDTLKSPDGGRVDLVDEGLSFFDAEGRLLVRYRDGALEIAPARGDLVLRSAQGSVRIDAAVDVIVAPARDIRLEAPRKVGMTAGAHDHQSRLTLDSRTARLAAPVLDVSSHIARVSIDRAAVTAGELVSTVKRLVTAAEEIETTAGRWIERAKSRFTEVAGTMKSRVGRVHAIVDEGYVLRSKRTDLRSTEDTAIDGRRILLG